MPQMEVQELERIKNEKSIKRGMNIIINWLKFKRTRKAMRDIGILFPLCHSDTVGQQDGDAGRKKSNGDKCRRNLIRKHHDNKEQCRATPCCVKS